MSWTEHLHLHAAAGLGRPGSRVSQPAPRDRQLHAAGGAEDLFARPATKMPAATTRRWPGSPTSRPAWPRFSRTTCSTCTTSSSATASASWRWNGSTATTWAGLLTREMLERTRERVEQPPLGISEQRDRHGRPGAAAAEAGHRDRGRARMPGGAGGAASRGDRARRHQAVEHHAQADRQRQDRRHRLGLRAGANAPAARPARRPTPRPKCSEGASVRRAPTWPAWATC